MSKYNIRAIPLAQTITHIVFNVYADWLVTGTIGKTEKCLWGTNGWAGLKTIKQVIRSAFSQACDERDGHSCRRIERQQEQRSGTVNG
jgi:hypothetical protein